jgi:NADH dehydrogenase
MRVLVLGGGYAGLTLVRRLESRLPADVDLTLVDDTGDHLVLHEVHRVVRRPDVAEFITVPLSDLLDRAELVTARVDGVDRDERTVRLHDGRTLDYDFAAVCLGSETADYGIPGVAEYGIPLKSVADAERIRDAFRSLDDDERVVVGGAGLSGVQVAGELAALGREDGVDADVVLLEQEATVAPSFPEKFRRAVGAELAACGVDVWTDTVVTGVTEEEIRTDGGSLDYGALVWTGGIRGPDALGGERPVVRADLRLDERTFVLGDAGRVVDTDGEAVPASAATAIREARPAADNVVRLVRAERDGADPDAFAPRLRDYRFRVPGWIVSVGDGAVAQVGPTVLRGGAARAMKATVGAGHLGSVGAVRQAVELAESEL